MKSEKLWYAAKGGIIEIVLPQRHTEVLHFSLLSLH